VRRLRAPLDQGIHRHAVETGEEREQGQSASRGQCSHAVRRRRQALLGRCRQPARREVEIDREHAHADRAKATSPISSDALLSTSHSSEPTPPPTPPTHTPMPMPIFFFFFLRRPPAGAKRPARRPCSTAFEKVRETGSGRRRTKKHIHEMPSSERTTTGACARFRLRPKRSRDRNSSDFRFGSVDGEAARPCAVAPGRSARRRCRTSLASRAARSRNRDQPPAGDALPSRIATRCPSRPCRCRGKFALVQMLRQ